MKIKNIQIQNFRGIKNLKLDLLDDLNVFVGVNGSGKSTILEAIATSVSWLVYRIQSPNANGKVISELSIHNGADKSFLEISVHSVDRDFAWKLVRSRRGVESREKSELENVSDLALNFQKQFKKSRSLPVVAYYPVNRMVEAKTPDIAGVDLVEILDVYKNSLWGKANFQSFFEWFRLQDDIKNEQAQSRNQWMTQNQGRIKEFFNDFILKLQHFSSPNASLIALARDTFSKPYILEDNRFLLDELAGFFDSLAHHIDLSERKQFLVLLTGLRELFLATAKLSNRKNDNLSGSLGMPKGQFNSIVKAIRTSVDSKTIEEVEKYFLWVAIDLLLLLTFWWLSPEGINKIHGAVDDYRFDDIQSTDEAHLIDFVETIVENEKIRFEQAFAGGRNLKMVTNAIEAFVPEFSNLRVTRIPSPQMLVEKKNKTLRVSQLSDGEKNMIALIGDIARRLSMANSTLKNPLDGEGLILIDEIDLHLHPKWQRIIIPKLKEVFPKCQFIVSTHSPQVLSHVNHENIFILNQVEDEITFTKPTNSYGMNSDRILEDLLGVDARPTKEKKMLHDLFQVIQTGTIIEARKKLAEMEEILTNEPELVKANVLIKRKEITGK